MQDNWSLLTEGCNVQEFGNITQIVSFGHMNTFKGQSGKNKYYIKILSSTETKHALQLGFCSDDFKVKKSNFYCNIENGVCSMLMHGVGDDEDGQSKAVDPSREQTWYQGQKSAMDENEQDNEDEDENKNKIKEGDVITVELNNNNLILTCGGRTLHESIMHKLKNPTPCISISGHLTIQLSYDGNAFPTDVGQGNANSYKMELKY